MEIIRNFIQIIVLFVFVIFSIYLYYFPFLPKLFTFWEPKEKIPGYLKLCIKTWKKFLFDYQIIILDYKLVKKLLGKILFDSIICKEMPLAVQSDAIRVALLDKYGGFWIDSDIIFLNKKIVEQIPNYELMMPREEKTKHHFIGMIYSIKDSIIIHEWLMKIIYKVKRYKEFVLKNKYSNKIKKKKNRFYSLNYLGNYIIDPILNNKTNNKFLFFDSNEYNIFPERNFFSNNSLQYYIDAYRNFYFSKGDPKLIIKQSKGLIYLHNSWTPSQYKKMSERQFLKQDVLLSKLLAEILDIKNRYIL